MHGAKAETAESSPVFGVLFLGATTLLLGTIVGMIGFGSIADSGSVYSGASISADFDRSGHTIDATAVNLRGADHVNVSVYGYGSGVKARLDVTGASLVVGRETARIRGSGTIYDMANDAVASSDGRTARLHEGLGVPSNERVTVRAVAEEGDQSWVVLDRTGTL